MSPTAGYTNVNGKIVFERQEWLQ